MMLNTRPIGLMFKQHPRDAANVNAFKNMCDPYNKLDNLINRIPGWRLLISSFRARLQERMLNRSASLAMSTSILEALPGKLDIKRHSPCIFYITASLAMSGKLDIKRHSPSILYISASLVMSASVLEALPGKLDIKRHSPCILYISASLAMSTSILEALPCKLDIKRHSPCVFYITASLAMSGKLDIKRHSPCILYISASLVMSTSVLDALPGKLDIKRHSPCILYISASLMMSTSVLEALPCKLDSPSILYLYCHMTLQKLDKYKWMVGIFVKCSTGSEIIRIHHECEGRIEKTVPRFTVWHHKACRVMTNGDPEERIFSPTLTRIMASFFLLTTVFIYSFTNFKAWVR